jgi:hypothetical protein
MCLSKRQHKTDTEVSRPESPLAKEVRSCINPVVFEQRILDLESDVGPSNPKSFIKAKEAEE